MDLKRTSRTVIINGVIAFAMGVLMMVWPGASAELVVRIFACWLAVIAITSLVFAPKGGRTGSLVTRAVLLILLGGLIFLTPMLFASMLTVLTGFAIIFFSFLALTVSFFIRRIGVRSWWVLTVIGVLGIVLGAFFLFAPQAGVTTLIFTLAGFIILVGIALVALGWRLRKADQRIKADPHRNRPDDGGGGVLSGEIIDCDPAASAGPPLVRTDRPPAHRRFGHPRPGARIVFIHTIEGFVSIVTVISLPAFTCACPPTRVRP